MTDINDAMGESWDLGDVLAERTQPKTSVDVYLNEAASFAKSELQKALAKATDGDESSAIEAQIEEIDKQLEERKYVVHLSGVPSRMRDDIASKALHTFPLKRDFLGRDDDENAIARQREENILTWHAQISDVVNPVGLHKPQWSRDEIEKFYDGIPARARQVVSQSIRELTEASEEFTAKSSSIDF